MVSNTGIKQLAALFRASNEIRPVMLLGAGASFRSGVPLAAEAVRRIAKATYIRNELGNKVHASQVKPSQWMPWLARQPWFIPGEERLAENFPLAVRSAASCGTITASTTTGFTNQEEMPTQCLVNLNARLYDPSTGKLLTADSMVPDAYDGQSYNRYAYVTNNPASLADPTGRGPITTGCIGSFGGLRCPNDPDPFGDIQTDNGIPWPCCLKQDPLPPPVNGCYPGTECINPTATRFTFNIIPGIDPGYIPITISAFPNPAGSTSSAPPQGAPKKQQENGPQKDANSSKGTNGNPACYGPRYTVGGQYSATGFLATMGVSGNVEVGVSLPVMASNSWNPLSGVQIYGRAQGLFLMGGGFFAGAGVSGALGVTNAPLQTGVQNSAVVQGGASFATGGEASLSLPTSPNSPISGGSVSGGARAGLGAYLAAGGGKTATIATKPIGCGG